MAEVVAHKGLLKKTKVHVDAAGGPGRGWTRR